MPPVRCSWSEATVRPGARGRLRHGGHGRAPRRPGAPNRSVPARTAEAPVQQRGGAVTDERVRRHPQCEHPAAGKELLQRGEVRSFGRRRPDAPHGLVEVTGTQPLAASGLAAAEFVHRLGVARAQGLRPLPPPSCPLPPCRPGDVRRELPHFRPQFSENRGGFGQVGRGNGGSGQPTSHVQLDDQVT